MTLFIKNTIKKETPRKMEGGGRQREKSSTHTAAQCVASQHRAAHIETQTQARSDGEVEMGEEEEQVGRERQPPAAPMGAATATRHHSCASVPAHAE